MHSAIVLGIRPTSACRQGRRTTITMRCDTTQKKTGAIQLPPNCPDGTCDGCNFHLMWRTGRNLFIIMNNGS